MSKNTQARPSSQVPLPPPQNQRLQRSQSIPINYQYSQPKPIIKNHESHTISHYKKQTSLCHSHSVKFRIDEDDEDEEDEEGESHEIDLFSSQDEIYSDTHNTGNHQTGNNHQKAKVYHAMSSYSSNFTENSTSSQKSINSDSFTSNLKYAPDSNTTQIERNHPSTSSGGTEPISIVPRRKLSVPRFDEHESKIDEIVTTIGQTFDGLSFESNELASSMHERVGSVIQTIKTGWTSSTE